MNAENWTLFDWCRFLNNYSACHPFKYAPENADWIFTEVIGDLEIIPFGDAKNELTYQEV